MVQKLTKTDDFPVRLGAFKPVDHAVVTLRDDTDAQTMATALCDSGFAMEDVLLFSATEMAERLRPLIGEASGAAGFGSEIQAMRAYLKLAEDGAGWVIVHAPDDAARDRVAEVAKRHGALQARMYNRLTVEEIV